MMEVVEVSADERYARYSEELGQGAYKTVYKAFDTNDALEVAWNKLHVDRLPAAEVAKVETEVALLRAVSHRNIINLYAFWRGPETTGRPASMDFITELMSSGTLKQYLKRSKSIKLRVIRRWCANLLDAIAYLHARNPPIMHRDLKCDNIFINGHLGEVCRASGRGARVGREWGRMRNGRGCWMSACGAWGKGTGRVREARVELACAPGVVWGLPVRWRRTAHVDVCALASGTLVPLSRCYSRTRVLSDADPIGRFLQYSLLMAGCCVTRYRR